MTLELPADEQYAILTMYLAVGFFSNHYSQSVGQTVVCIAKL